MQAGKSQGPRNAFSDAKTDQCHCSRVQHKDTLQAWHLRPLLTGVSSMQQHGFITRARLKMLLVVSCELNKLVHAYTGRITEINALSQTQQCTFINSAVH